MFFMCLFLSDNFHILNELDYGEPYWVQCSHLASGINLRNKPNYLETVHLILIYFDSMMDTKPCSLFLENGFFFGTF